MRPSGKNIAGQGGSKHKHPGAGGVCYVGGHQSSAAGMRERQEIAGEVREVMESQRAWGLFSC